MSGYKLVIRGLPFEATIDQLVSHFELDERQIEMATWTDSGRCRGHAFVTVATEGEADRLRNFHDTEFTVEQNTRELKVTDFEERPPRSNQRRSGGRRKRGRNNNNPERNFEVDVESQREIYVSNVPWKAEEEDFHRVFGECGQIEDITIPKIHNSGKPKGFAFVRFATVEGRDEAINRCNGTQMIDRTIGVRANKGRPSGGARRERRPPRTGLSEKPEGCTTIFVGNLPWSADEERLEEVFSQCGDIKNTRIVRQSWTHKSRGFGYVEFEHEASVDDAVQLRLELEGRLLRLDYTESQSYQLN